MQNRFALIGLLLIVLGCYERDYPQLFPIILTHAIVNISSDGAEFSGSVESLGSNQKITQYGFVWSESDKPTVNSSYLVISENIQIGRFSKVVNNDLSKGVTYYVRAFVQTDKLIVYGNSVSFESAGSRSPVIIDFTPQKGFDGAEVIIMGTNFSVSPDRIQVKIGDILSKVVSATDSELKIIVPNSSLVGDFKISIIVAGKQVISDKPFSILGPRIKSMSKLSGRVGDIITMEGEYFEESSYMSLFFGPIQQYTPNYSYPYINSFTQVECYVPDYPNKTGKIELLSYPQNILLREKKYVFSESFTIINSWSKISDQAPLEGPSYKSAQLNNLVYVLGGKALYVYDINTGIWTRKADFPGEYRFSGTAFSYEGKIYYGFGEGYWEPPLSGSNGKYFNDLWIYNPSDNSWNKLGDTPLSKRHNLVSFVINNKIYIGLGLVEDIWEFDPLTNSWTQIQVPFSKSFGRATSFVVNNKAYLVGVEHVYQTSDVWEFDSSGPSWSKKSDFPAEVIGQGATASVDRGYLIHQNSYPVRAYEYDPFKDRWIQRQSLPGSTTTVFQFSHYYQNKLIYCAGNMWQLDF